ncbi:MAG: AAA family ATPase [Candidatus Omnitrophica bacterium]|nr:AAA family ATPase [Candidatus Omnitrophota bacterium]
MLNPTEQAERQYLDTVKAIMRRTLEHITARIHEYSREIKAQKAYLWENKTGMDHVEKISVRQSVDQQVLTAEAVADSSKRIRKLLQNPYFGRFDFLKKDTPKPLPVYIGIHGFVDEDKGERLIHDWRAPVSTLFYDYETGPAHFDAPGGRMFGEITLKRQYRIRDGAMEFMIETDLNIHDDILQKELSLASDDKMKNIVATIQRDQNAIIRNENSPVLIIQGVAGSGKTSIALHRIAFLLYRFKEDITAHDILIISPNKVFADYISSVLPELGEENIPEVGIEELAKDLLERKFKFQTFFEQVTLLLEKNDKALQERIRAKATSDFLHKLDEYIAHIEATYFQAVNITIRGKLVPSWFMAERFESYTYLSIQARLTKIAKDIETNIGIYYRKNLTPAERAEIKASVKKMFKVTTLRALYKDFYRWLGRPELLKMIGGAVFEYADVYPLIYLKMRWDGLKTFDHVKHLLIDEMQDYAPVQYAVISKLFACKKTILGDANQSVNPFSSSSADKIRKVFTDADTVKLNTSYRSTYEITTFAQGISPNSELEPIERHGAAVAVRMFDNTDAELQEVSRLLGEFQETGQHSLGIILRTQRQAEEFHHLIKKLGHKVYLLTAQSDAFRQGALVCTAHMAKGLEFDHVIVPQASAQNYRTEMDKKMLYVACTRAMHRLTLTTASAVSTLIPA